MVTNIHDAKTHFSKLVERAEAGEEIVIGRAGRPVAKLVPYLAPRPDRVPGALRGRIWIAPDVDDGDDRVAGLFEGAGVDVESTPPP
jgi:prevent-host-death family protein